MCNGFFFWSYTLTLLKWYYRNTQEFQNKLKLGCHKVNLLVRSDNVGVSNFYEGIGYKKQDDISVFGKRLISDDWKKVRLL